MSATKPYVGFMVAIAGFCLSTVTCVLDRSGQAEPSDGGATTAGGNGGTAPGPGPGPAPGPGPGPGPGGSGGTAGAGGVGGAGGTGGNTGGGGQLTIPTELDITGLQLWHRSDFGVDVDVDAVTAWTDASGNGHDATPAADPRRPRLVADAINGHGVLEFDGIDDALRISDAAGLDPGTSSFLYVAVGSWINTTGAYTVWTGKATPTSDDNWRLFRNVNDALELYYGMDGLFYPASDGALTTDVTYVLGCGVDATTNEVIYIINSSVERKPITISGAGSNNLALTLGGDVTSYPSNIRIAEQAYYTRSAGGFATSEIDDIVTYMMARYGL